MLCLRDDLSPAIDELGQVIDHGLRQIGNDAQAAAHVTVEGAIADRHLAFIAGGEQQIAEFVGERHQHVAANPCLNIFLGYIRLFPGKVLMQGIKIGGVYLRDGNDLEIDPQVVSKDARVLHAARGRIDRGHGNAENIFAADGCSSQAGGHRGINPAGKAQQRFGEPAFAQVIANTQDEPLRDGLNALLGHIGDCSGGVFGINNPHLFFKGRQDGGELSGVADNHASAVKDKLIIAADKIYKNKRGVMPGRMAGDERVPELFFPHIKGRCREVYEKGRSLFGQYLQGVTGIRLRAAAPPGTFQASSQMEMPRISSLKAQTEISSPGSK